MTAFLWAMLALYALATLKQLSRLSSGEQEQPLTPSARRAVILIQIAIMAWIGYLLVAPAA
jgi:hypothetical protein